jgi:hypothetical protein
MATTTNYSWSTPDDTALVKDGAAAIRSLGTAIDTTVFTNAGAAIAKTLIDAEGDLIVGDAADAVQRLAVGSNGNVLTVDTSVDGKIKWAAPAGGGGKVLQVVYGSTTTGVSNATNSYADTGLTASITPSLSSSKVAVFVSQNGMGKNNDGGATTNAVNCKLFRGATEISYIQMMGYSEDNSLDLGMSWCTNILDEPATTSSTTYKVQFANNRNGNGVEAQYGSARSSIILMEIGV